MVTIGYSTRKKNEEYKKHLLKMFGNPKVEIIEVVNNNKYSLTEVYNKILNKAKYDIVVLLHDDLIIESKQNAKKIVKLFEKNEDFGIIGVAGTKHLPKSGRWWETPRTMFGKVKHTNEGKTHLSEYNESLNKNSLEQVVVVDGVFIAIDKTRIRHMFDESVKGFHFYDIDFCFKNYLSNVKIGVTTDILINHMSIGQTNEQWEENRREFEIKYKQNLPEKIFETFETKKLNLLYFFDKNKENYNNIVSTAKELIKLNCKVSLVGNFNTYDVMSLSKSGIKLYHTDEPPGFKKGDGKFMIKTKEGNVKSQPNKLYKIGAVNYDIGYTDNYELHKQIQKLYPEVKFADIETKEYYLTNKEPNELLDYFKIKYNE